MTPEAPDPWESARETTREQVRAALARREAEVRCAHCGWTGVSGEIRCPQCGRLWSARRRRGLSPRGRRIAIGSMLRRGRPHLRHRLDRRAAHQRVQRDTAAREKRQRAAADAAQTAFLRREQRPHHALAAPAPSGNRAARLAAVALLERDITRDARARVRAGSLKGPVLRTVCETYPVNVGLPRIPPTDPAGRYQCYAVTSEVKRGNGKDVGFIGQPFWARANFPTGALVWCRTNPRPGERGLQVLSAEVPLPRECDIRS